MGKIAELESKRDPIIVMVVLSFNNNAPPPSENKVSLDRGANELKVKLEADIKI